MDKRGLAVASVLVFAFFVALVPGAFAVGSEAIEISVDKTSGKTTDSYAFTADWGVSIISQSGFTFSKDMELQYKSSSGAWKPYSSSAGIVTGSGATKQTWYLTMQTVASGKTKWSFIPAQDKSDRVTNGVYSFRLSYKSGTIVSNEVKISFNDACTRKTPVVTPKLLPGTWYSVGSDGYTANVPLEDGKQLGGGKVLEYTLSVKNFDTGCGASKFRLDVEGTGVDRDAEGGAGKFGPYIFSVTKPSGGVANIEGNGVAEFGVRLAVNDKIGGTDITEGGNVAKGGVVTFKFTNVDSGLHYTKNVQVKVVTIEECNYDTPPQVVIEPQSQIGYAGEKLTYKVRIQNRNTGGEEECAVGNFEVTRTGIQYFEDVQRGDLGEFRFADQYSWRWTTFIGDKLYSATAQSNVFDGNKGGTTGNYIEFIPKAGPPYTVQIPVNSEKEVKMEVSSYDPSLCSTCTQQPGYGPRSVAVCVRTAKQSEVCGKAFYDFKSKLDTSVGERILIDIGSSYKVGSALNMLGYLKDGPTPITKAQVRMDVFKPDGTKYYGRVDSTDSTGKFQAGVKIEEGSPSGVWKLVVSYEGSKGTVTQSAAFTVLGKDDTSAPTASTKITDIVAPSNAGPNVDSIFTWKLNDVSTFVHTNVHCYGQIVAALKGGVDRITTNDWAAPAGELAVMQVVSEKITSKTGDDSYTGKVKFPYADEKTGFYCRVHVETSAGEHLLSEVQTVKVYSSGTGGGGAAGGPTQSIIVTKEPESQISVGKFAEFKWKTDGVSSFGATGHTNLHCFYSPLPAWRTQTLDVQTKKITTPAAEYSDGIIPDVAKKYWCRIHADDGAGLSGDKGLLSKDIWSIDCGTTVCSVTKVESSADVGGNPAAGGGGDGAPPASGQKVTMTSAPSGTINVDQAVEFRWKTEGISSIAAGHTNLHCYTRSNPAWRTDSVELTTTNARMTTTSSSGEYSDTAKFPANKKYWCRAHADSGTVNSPLSKEVYVIDCGATTCSVTKEESPSDTGGVVTSVDNIEITMITTPATGTTGSPVTFQWRLSGLTAFGHDNAHTNVHCLKQSVGEKKSVDQVSLLEWAITPADLQPYFVGSEKIKSKGDSYSGAFTPDVAGKYYCKVHATSDDYNHFLTTSTFTVDVAGGTVTNPGANTGGVQGDYIKDVKYPAEVKAGGRGTFSWKVSGLDSFAHTNVHCARPSVQNVDKMTEADWGTITGDKAANGQGLSKSSSGEYSQEVTFSDEGTYKCRIHVDAGTGRTYLLNPAVSSEPYKVSVVKSSGDAGAAALTCGDSDAPNDVNNAETVSAGKKCNQIDTSDKDYYRLEIDKTKKYTIKTTGCGQTGGAETKLKMSLKTNSDVYVALSEGKKGSGADCSVIEFGPLLDESNLVRFIEVTGTKSGIYNLEISN